MDDPLAKCPEALHHGPPDANGHCPWCGRKVTAAVHPFTDDRTTGDLAYEYHYDPDFAERPGHYTDRYTAERPRRT